MTAPRPALTARAPTRLDFGGGWTDVPPYSTREGGCVCCVAIARYAQVRLRPAAAPGTEPERDRGAVVPLVDAARRRAGIGDVAIELTSDFPVGAGLGGSSAAGVALAAALAAWQHRTPTAVELAEWSRATEVEECGIAGGRQDHYAAAVGGALGLRFRPGDLVEVERIALDAATHAALERRCIVAYTGEARVSATTITGVLDAYAAGEPRVVDALARMRELAERMIAALGAGDVDALGRLVGEHWTHQRSLHPAIPTPAIDRLLAAARDAGALGGKALGASGGGCVLAIAEAGRDDAVRAALGRQAELLPFTIATRGVEVLDG